MKALIIGATGATGKDLVNVLLNDPDYTAVVTFVRRPGGLTHPKLREIITDFNHPESVQEYIKGDVWFSCLGTTMKTAGSREKQWEIDYGIPMKFAELAQSNGVPCAVILSSYGASATSGNFYLKMKGTLDNDVVKTGFEKTIIFRPGLLLRKDSDRFFERLMARTLIFLNRLGLVKKYRPMPTEVLAEKMAAAKDFSAGVRIVELDAIFG